MNIILCFLKLHNYHNVMYSVACSPTTLSVSASCSVVCCLAASSCIQNVRQSNVIHVIFAHVVTLGGCCLSSLLESVLLSVSCGTKDLLFCDSRSSTSSLQILPASPMII